MRGPFSAFPYTPAQLLCPVASLILLVALGFRLHALWPQPEIQNLPLPVSISPEFPQLDTTALEKLTLFRPPEAKGPAAFRIGAIDEDSPLLRNAPPSTLNARLVGVLSGPHGIAIVERASRQGSYSRGDALTDQVNLVRIFNDRIVISHRGQYEALLLD
jgi:general secretion pathway protein C